MELTKVCSLIDPITSKTKDFTLYSGITFRAAFKFNDKNKQAIPLGSKVVTFHIFDAQEIENILTISSEFITDNGSTVEVTDSINGTVDIVISDEETALLNFEQAKWWVTLTMSNGDVFLRGRGSIFLKEPYDDELN